MTENHNFVCSVYDYPPTESFPLRVPDAEPSQMGFSAVPQAGIQLNSEYTSHVFFRIIHSEIAPECRSPCHRVPCQKEFLELLSVKKCSELTVSFHEPSLSGMEID